MLFKKKTRLGEIGKNPQIITKYPIDLISIFALARYYVSDHELSSAGWNQRIYIRPKKIKSLSQLPARIAFKIRFSA